MLQEKQELLQEEQIGIQSGGFVATVHNPSHLRNKVRKGLCPIQPKDCGRIGD